MTRPIRRDRPRGSLAPAVLAALGLLAGVSATSWADTARAQDGCIGPSECLDQGWNAAQRAWWYSVSQGSRLLPLSWALALEVPEGGAALFGKASMAGYGYLPNPASEVNPFGLPVGFAVDHNPTRNADLMCGTFPEACLKGVMREPWIGMNCAACHTSEIEFEGRRLRVEGAPTLADFDGFTRDVLLALEATLADGPRRDRFSRAVLGTAFDFATRESIRQQLEEQIAWMTRLQEKNGTDMPAGHGRLDAQGHILNKVSLVIGVEDQIPGLKSEAPASYPFIWNTHQQGRIQWNGIAGNQLVIPFLPRDTDVGALIRNTSEVIGVFAHVDADRDALLFTGYDSSVRVRELVGMERQLATLTSPEWPEDLLGPLDPAKVARGRTLFDADCARCHSHLEPDDLVSDANERMSPLTETGSGTDIFLACNTYLHRSKAGHLEGRWSRLVGIGDSQRIEAEDATHLMLAHVAIGSVFAKAIELTGTLFEDIAPQPGPTVVLSSAADSTYLPDIADPAKRALARRCLSEPILSDKDLRQYKARPLNGIWATAPYLHNGSVPTLYDLLLPSTLRNPTVPVAAGAPPHVVAGETRPERFGVGSRLFDPEKVGFVTDEAANPTLFTVRDAEGRPIPGNFNSGHDYGNAAFSDEDRLALVEYLKSL